MNRRITGNLARSVLARTITRRNEAWAEAAEIDRLVEFLPELRKWLAIAEIIANEADRALVLAILTLDPQFDEATTRSEPQLDPWPGRAVRFEGRIYAAIRDPDRSEDDPGGSGYDLMRLAILEEAQLLDLHA